MTICILTEICSIHSSNYKVSGVDNDEGLVSYVPFNII